MENQFLKSQVAALQKLVEAEREGLMRERQWKPVEDIDEGGAPKRTAYSSGQSPDATNLPSSGNEHALDFQKKRPGRNDAATRFQDDLDYLGPDLNDSPDKYVGHFKEQEAGGNKAEQVAVSDQAPSPCVLDLRSHSQVVESKHWHFGGTDLQEDDARETERRTPGLRSEASAPALDTAAVRKQRFLERRKMVDLEEEAERLQEQIHLKEQLQRKQNIISFHQSRLTRSVTSTSRLLEEEPSGIKDPPSKRIDAEDLDEEESSWASPEKKPSFSKASLTQKSLSNLVE